MKPIIREIDEKYIEVIGHYDNPILCAKMTILADLFAIEKRDGYALFKVEDYDKLAKIDDSLKFAITDLTNTTWVINDNPNTSTAFDYSINFESDGYPDYVGIRVSSSSHNLLYVLPDTDFDTAYNNSTGQWNGSSYKTIIITGGTDVTNQDLIAWLQENAVQQTEPEPSPSTTNNISLGNLAVSKMYLGSTEISKICLGNTEIYSASGGGDTPTPSEPEVTITFQNAINPGFWAYTKIYDNYTIYNGDDFRPSGNVIAQITSANGSVTVTSTTGKLFIESVGSSTSRGTVTVSGNVTQAGTSHIRDLVGAFDVTGDGSIVVNGTDYDS